MNWFFGFKLHLICNNKGEIVNFTFSPGNVDDRDLLRNSNLTDKLFGKRFADQGHISQNLFEQLFIDDIHLVTKIKKNIKNSLMNIHGKILPRKRALIETVNNKLKNICQIEGGNVTKKHRFPPSSEKFPSVVQRSLHSKHVEMLSASFF